MLLRGATGSGKSFLLDHLQMQCKKLGVAHVRIRLADPLGVDGIKIMRDVRDGLGEVEFRLFTNLLNYYTTDGYTLKLQVEVINQDARSGGGVTVQDQAVVDGVVAGRDAIVISDNKLSAPRRDIEFDKRRMQDDLTRHFLENLIGLCRQRQIVCLFDDVDRLDVTAAYWLWQDLLPPMIEQRNFLAVLTSTTAPSVERAIYAAMVDVALGNLPEAYVVEYLERRGVPTDDRRVVAGFVMSDVCGYGNPEQMAKLVDSYFKPRPGAAL